MPAQPACQQSGACSRCRCGRDTWHADITSFNTVTARWDRAHARVPFAPRAYHTATLVGDEIVVVGGSDKDEPFDDVWAYKPADGRWRQVCVKCAPHGCRSPAPDWGAPDAALCRSSRHGGSHCRPASATCGRMEESAAARWQCILPAAVYHSFIADLLRELPGARSVVLKLEP